MTKMFGNLTDTAQMETASDTLGGGGAIASGAYDGTIELVYAGQSSGGALNVTVHFKTTDGREVRETIYFTNKKGENFYLDKQDATKKHPLPGFTTVNDLCLLATGVGLADQETEEKTVKIYDANERKELPKPVQCLTALHGQPISLGILRVLEDKMGKDSGGNYTVPTGEIRTFNTIDKVFHPETGRTVNEYLQEVETPEFKTAWIQKNDGKDRNKAKGLAAAEGSTGSGRPGGAAGTATKSLFGKK